MLGDRSFSFFIVPSIVHYFPLPASFERDFANPNHTSRLHTSTAVGKKLSRLFYKKDYTKSYFLGCSLGGRQGVKAAEKFPGDFDGIVAGSPALDFNNLQSWRANFFIITGPTNASDFISPSMWKTLIHEEVLNQCDGLDGAMDGIIEDPSLCRFRPEAIQCKDKSITNCLTPSQAEKVRAIFSPLYRDHRILVYPAMQPGSEIMAVEKLYAGKPFSYSEVMTLRICITPLLNNHLPTELVQIRNLQPFMACSQLQHPRRRRSRSAEPFKHPNMAL